MGQVLSSLPRPVLEGEQMDTVQIRNEFSGGIAQVDVMTAVRLAESGWVRIDLEDKPAPVKRAPRRAAQKPAGDTNTKE